jgi:hypothetical protein
MTITIDLDDHLVEAARRRAEENGEHLEDLVAGYLTKVLRTEAATDNLPDESGRDFSESLTPWTKSLLGVAKGSEMDEDDYYRYLEKKHR